MLAVVPLLAALSASADGSRDARYLPAGLAPRDDLGRYLASSAPVGRPSAGSPSRVPAPDVSAVLTTVDDDSFAGAENAIYAADRKTIYIAYKRFLRDPFDPGGDVVPAELRIAKSEDGGGTWAVTVLDADAPEEGDLLEQSVAIDGDHGDAVYVSYLVEGGPRSGGEVLMVARSLDGGATWRKRLVSVSAGQFKDMKVLDAHTVLIAANADTGVAESLRMFMTVDGAHWTSSRVGDGAYWYVGLDRGGAGRIWLSFYDGGHDDLLTATATSPSGPWTTRRTAGQPDDQFYTGLWSSLDLSKGEVFVSFEDFQPSRGRSVIRVIRSSDGGKTWTRSTVDSGFGVGGKISLHVWTAPATTDVFLSYWHFRTHPTRMGEARVAHSVDGGATWTVGTLPEADSVFPYIDTAVVNRDLQYVSYQVRNLDTGDQFLRMATVAN